MDTRRSRYLILSSIIALMIVCITAAFSAVPSIMADVRPQLARSRFQLGELTNQSLESMTALTEVNGQIYGAGANKVALIGENGAVTRSIPTNISNVGGIAPYEGGNLIIGDTGSNTVFKLDPKSGALTKLLSLSEIRNNGSPFGRLLSIGQLTSVGYDGSKVYVGISAGYASSIFKVDQNTKTMLAQSWASGPNPVGIAFSSGGIYVLDGSRQQLRRINLDMQGGSGVVDIPAADAKGIIIKNDQVMLLSPAAKSIIKFDHQLIAPTKQVISSSAIRSAIDIGKIKIKPAVSNKYAVLICGSTADTGYDEFWNDTVWIYKTLRAAGYTANNIYVLYGNGSDYASANPSYQSSEKVTDFPAKKASVDMVFDGLKNGDAANGITKMTEFDTLFVWTFDHGGGWESPVCLCLMDGNVQDTYFASKLNAIPYSTRAIFMQQCFSGGFIDELKNSKTFISTAASGWETAHQADSEKELYNSKYYHHGEYNYYLISALAGKTPTGSAYNADTNGDGIVSMLEAHNCVVNHENQPETPQKDDMGSIGADFFLN